MKSILLVSATSFEIAPALQFLSSFTSNKIRVASYITGVGMVSTAFELGRLSGQKFDLVINAGIAGSFGALEKGAVVKVSHDCFAELGAENDTEFLSIDELGFGKQAVVIQHKIENAFTDKISEASGITVNTTHGNVISIQNMVTRYQPDVETMEGAAFIHAANAFSWRAIQLRAISNLVEKRNKENWDIPLAIKNLNTTLIDLIKHLNEH